MRTMYDDVNADNIPATATLMAGYVDGNWPSYQAMRDRFPHATVVPIAVSWRTNAGTVLDCENGDATPSECPAWVFMRRARGVDPTVYCSSDVWPAVRAAFQGAHIPEPHYWIAQWDGQATIPAGAVAKQYQSLPNYDVSAVADHWPGVDPTPPPEDTVTPQDKQDIINGVLAGIKGVDVRDALAGADLWWLDHALGGTTTPEMSPGQAALVTDIHRLVVELNATPAPAPKIATTAPAAVTAADVSQPSENAPQEPAQAPAETAPAVPAAE